MSKRNSQHEFEPGLVSGDQFRVSAKLLPGSNELAIWAIHKSSGWLQATFITCVSRPADEDRLHAALADAMPTVRLMDDKDRVHVVHSVVAAALSGDYLFAKRSR